MMDLPSLVPDVTESEMLAFLAVIIRMGHGTYWPTAEHLFMTKLTPQ
jgi:hypothetical protein